MVLISYFLVLMWSQFTPMRAQLFGFAACKPQGTTMAGICAYWCWFLTYAKSAAVSQPFKQYGGACRFGDSAESHLNLLPSIHGRKRSSFQGLFPPDDIVASKSVLDIKPSGCTVGDWLSGWQIYPYLIGGMCCCSITDLPRLNERCHIYITSHLTYVVSIMPF